jgi:hypothetical protein
MFLQNIINLVFLCAKIRFLNYDTKVRTFQTTIYFHYIAIIFRVAELI